MHGIRSSSIAAVKPQNKEYFTDLKSVVFFNIGILVLISTVTLLEWRTFLKDYFQSTLLFDRIEAYFLNGLFTDVLCIELPNCFATLI